MNAGKERAVLRFVADYRDLAVQVARVQWRQFFEAGGTDKYAPAKHLNGICGAAPVQMATFQVQEQIDGWVSNRANEFAEVVRCSKLPDVVKRQLRAINRRGLGFSRGPAKSQSDLRDIVAFDLVTRDLARSIMRHVMGRHRRPDLSGVSPRLDSRAAVVARAQSARHADLWARLTLPHRPAILMPLHSNTQFNRRGGELCPVVQLCTEAGRVTVRLVQDMAKPFAALRAAYVPRTERLALDFGLATLLATSEGTLFGRGLIADLARIDKLLVGIARHRMQAGGKPRDSERYRKLVLRVRGMLKTRINAALNRIVRLHAPAALVVERLDFRLPGLTRRMNRLVSNCGRAVFRQKLADLHDKYKITATEEHAAYTSQECSLCGYVDARNRPSQSRFACRWCGNATHADIDASRVVIQRRSLASDTVKLGKAAILALLVRRHVERGPWLRSNGAPGAAHDPRLSNPYFKGWADAARNALLTTGSAV